MSIPLVGKRKKIVTNFCDFTNLQNIQSLVLRYNADASDEDKLVANLKRVFDTVFNALCDSMYILFAFLRKHFS